MHQRREPPNPKSNRTRRQSRKQKRRRLRGPRGHAPAPGRAEEPEPAAPEPAPEAEPPSAQVIPFPAPAAAKEKKISALAPGLARTRSAGFVARLGELFSGRKELDPSIVDEIEKVLLTADIGVKTSQKLLEEIRSSLSRRELKDPDAVWAFLRQRSAEMLSLPAPELDFSSAKPFVLLVIGVNGSGKTTTIGKMAAKLTGRESGSCSPPATPFVPPRPSNWRSGPDAPAPRSSAAKKGLILHPSSSMASSARRPRASTSQSPTPPDGCTPRPI